MEFLVDGGVVGKPLFPHFPPEGLILPQEWVLFSMEFDPLGSDTSFRTNPRSIITPIRSRITLVVTKPNHAISTSVWRRFQLLSPFPCAHVFQIPQTGWAHFPQNLCSHLIFYENSRRAFLFLGILGGSSPSLFFLLVLRKLHLFEPLGQICDG